MKTLNYDKQKSLADPECPDCHGEGVVQEGQHDDVRDVPCVCTLGEEADFTGATEGDR